jgi:hypothetical protein
LAVLIALASCPPQVAELTLEVWFKLGVTAVGVAGAGSGLLVFDPPDQAGSAAATDRTAIKAMPAPLIRARRHAAELIKECLDANGALVSIRCRHTFIVMRLDVIID